MNTIILEYYYLLLYIVYGLRNSLYNNLHNISLVEKNLGIDILLENIVISE